MIRYIELFAGIGGFRYGLEKASLQRGRCEDTQPKSNMSKSGSRNKRGRWNEQPTFSCVWANDNDKYACQIYRKQWGDMCESDIRTVDANTIPEHDLLCAGFPCQSFSIAGKRQGFQDIRGTLFFEICRVLRVKRPHYLFLENVKGLLSSDDGRTFYTILTQLDDLGYDCQWQVLNSKDYGVPQNRERVFIIGNIRGQPRPKVFPIRNSNKTNNELQGFAVGAITGRRGTAQSDGDYIIESNGETQEPIIVQALDANYGKGNAGFGGSKRALVNLPQAQRVRQTNNISSTLQGLAGGQGGKTGLYEIPPIANAIDPDGYLRSGQRPRDVKGNPQLLPIGYRRIRRLTPIECERLQGFPDNFTKYGIDNNGKGIEISDTQRYKVCGNAVTTSVITTIGNQLLKSIIEPVKENI